MAAQNGTKLMVYVDASGTDTAIASSKSFTLSIDQELIDISTKDSAGWTYDLEGKRTWSVDFELLYDPTQTWNAEELMDQIINRSGTIKLNFGFPGTSYPVAGSFWEGSAFAKNVKLTGGVEDVATVSGQFVGDGALTKKAYTGGGSMS